MIHAHHHKNYSSGMIRNGAPADDISGGTSGEVITRQMTDEEWERVIGRARLKRSRYNGRTYYEEPTKSEGEETPHGTV